MTTLYDKILEYSTNVQQNPVVMNKSSKYLLHEIDIHNNNNIHNNNDNYNDDRLVLECASTIAYECYHTNNTNYNTNIKFQELLKLIKSNNKTVYEIINITIGRINLFDCYKKKDWREIIKKSNLMIKSWPKIQGWYIPGLLDVLIMLSHSYNCLGMYEDGLHSVRLAIQISHEGLEMMTKYHEKKIPLKLLFIGPILSGYEAVVTSYHCLAIQLSYDSNLINFSNEWHKRSINSCIKFKINVFIINLFCENFNNAININTRILQSIPTEVFVSINQEDSKLLPSNIETKATESNPTESKRESVQTSSGKSKRPHSAGIDNLIQTFSGDKPIGRPKSAASKLGITKTPTIENKERRLEILKEKDRKSLTYQSSSSDNNNNNINSYSNEQTVKTNMNKTNSMDLVVVASHRSHALLFQKLKEMRYNAAVKIQSQARRVLSMKKVMSIRSNSKYIPSKQSPFNNESGNNNNGNNGDKNGSNNDNNHNENLKLESVPETNNNYVSKEKTKKTNDNDTMISSYMNATKHLNDIILLHDYYKDNCYSNSNSSSLGIFYNTYY